MKHLSEHINESFVNESLKMTWDGFTSDKEDNTTFHGFDENPQKNGPYICTTDGKKNYYSIEKASGKTIKSTNDISVDGLKKMFKDAKMNAPEDAFLKEVVQRLEKKFIV